MKIYQTYCHMDGVTQLLAGPDKQAILGFLLGNTKSRFTVHVQLRRLDYDDVPSIDWCISLSAVQGHSRVSDVADPSTLGEPLTLDHCRALETGKASETRDSPWVTSGRKASPAAWPFIWSMLGARRRRSMGRTSSSALFLADNGVVLSYNTIPARYLSFHTRPPHEKDPAGRRWERRAQEEGVPMGTGSSEARATGGSPMGEGPGQAHRQQLEALLLRRNQMLPWALLRSTWTTCGE